MSTNQKVILVTGCAKGDIGYEYCMAFVEQNCCVFASDIPKRFFDMSELKGQQQQIETLELDVSSDESVASIVKYVIYKWQNRHFDQQCRYRKHGPTR